MKKNMTLFLRLLSLTLLCLGLNFSTTAQCTGTVLLTLGNGDDGEGIAFNPNDGQIYHTSGISDGQAYFEPINLTTLTIGANLFPLNTAPGLEIGGVVWSPFYNAFIFMDSNDDIYSITNTGTLTFLSNLSAGYLRGFIAAGVNMYGVNPFGNNLVLFNTATGATISDIPMTSTAGTVNGATALSHNPANGKDYVIFRMSSGSNRHLGEIDLNTGVITYIDNLGQGWAGMTFDNTGKMYLVSGDGAPVPETLYTNFTCAPPIVAAAVPALSTWGILIFGLLMLSLGSIQLFRQKVMTTRFI